MTLRELLLDERLSGRVVDKYRLGSGNLGLVVESRTDGRRYAVEFQTDRARPRLANLYGLIREPFKETAEHLERLLAVGDEVDLAVGLRHGPLRTAYALDRVSASSAAEYRLARPDRPQPRLVAYGHGPGY